MQRKTRAFIITLLLVLTFTYLKDTNVVHGKEQSTFQTSNYEPYNFQLEVKDKKLTIQNIPDGMKEYYLWFRIYSESTKDIVYDTVCERDQDKVQIDMSDLSDATYRVYLFYGEKRYGTYKGYWWDDGAPKVTKSGGTYSFTVGDYYNEIASIHNNFLNEDYMLEYFMKPSIWVESDAKVIYEKAIEITKDTTSDYEKIYKVYQWVIENIYYDYDGLYGRSELLPTALDVLEGKKGVCHGYANLVAALLRSIDIPTMVVTGNAASPIKKEDENHAWNMAYVDGRWIFLDSTWDSNNQYAFGQYVTNAPNKSLMWFDTSLEVVAYSHYVVSDMPQMAIADMIEGYRTEKVDITYGSVTKGVLSSDIMNLKLPDGYQFIYVTSVGKSIASVDKKGNITFTGKQYSDEIEVTVILQTPTGTGLAKVGDVYYQVYDNCKIESSKLSTKSVTVGKSYTMNIPALKQIESSVKYSITYTSSNTKVAKVSKMGVVKAKTKGKTTITATIKVGTKKYTFKQVVNVK